MSVSLLEYFRSGPPAPPVVLLPDAHFFVRAVPVVDAKTPDEVAAQVGLALETLAPFPLAQLNHGFFWAPGSGHALAFAAYRRRFPIEQTASWAGAELVIPSFVTVCGQPVAPSTTVLLPGTDSLTAVHWGNGAVPDNVRVCPLPAEATDEDRSRVRAELLREVGESLKVVELSATPTPVPSKDSGQLAFSAGDHALTLPVDQTPWLDVRDKAEFAVLRKAKARDAWLWRIFIGSAAAMLMFGVGELALVGGHFWQKARQAQVAAQLPVVQKARTAHELATRIEELATQRLLPFEMIDAVKAKRRSIQFQRVTASASGLNQLVIEAQTSSPADVSAYQTELTQNPAIETAEVGELRSRDRVTTFTLTVTFKAGALKPVPTT
jgi:hypothetical protein